MLQSTASDVNRNQLKIEYVITQFYHILSFKHIPMIMLTFFVYNFPCLKILFFPGNQTHQEPQHISIILSLCFTHLMQMVMQEKTTIESMQNVTDSNNTVATLNYKIGAH